MEYYVDKLIEYMHNVDDRCKYYKLHYVAIASITTWMGFVKYLEVDLTMSQVSEIYRWCRDNWEEYKEKYNNYDDIV